MIALMARSRRAKSAEFATPQWKYITRRMAAQLAHDDLRDVMHTVVDISLGSRYGSLVNAFKPGYFFWECADMLRKLILVGMLTLVEQGSTLQVRRGTTMPSRPPSYTLDLVLHLGH